MAGHLRGRRIRSVVIGEGWSEHLRDCMMNIGVWQVEEVNYVSKDVKDDTRSLVLGACEGCSLIGEDLNA